ncbi:WD40 repeat domain-containing protein [Actinomadura bangladeshensis]|uniref:WD40 repeat domain-containing protein n=1 Tax=Actinomadura bangladeshensis TaxID=453573 RepID=A0A4R4P2I9_9ACTN|nr:WD40 repeat domain-containing protein [Actinomadura bangladeshensis]TDC14870.1 WD40 repeat domain-containing protein [Actinomadura bangladeshensis]
MKPETIVKSTLDAWAEEARVPAGLADRALRGRTRRRSFKIALVGGTSALLAGATAVVLVSAGGPVRPSQQVAFEPVSLSADTSLRTDLGSGFPSRLVAAGHTAVAAYYTGNTAMGAERGTVRRTWHLYNPSTGAYGKTDWAYLDVAPGMQRAAVLRGPLPASKVGVLDMKTQKVTRWIEVDHPVGGLAWSPDGRRLLLTSYSSNPDVIGGVPGASPRTGYYVVDSAAEPGAFHTLPGLPGNPNHRQDLGWSRDGKLIWAPTATEPTKVFYDQDGRKRPAPAHEAEDQQEAGLSPNGALRARFGPAPGPAVTITDVKSDRKVAVLPIQQALAWADDGKLFAMGCDVKKCEGKGEFRNRLLLVTLKGKITPLTGYQRSDRAGSWTPLFTHR